mgnify:CR=1 FL=1
MSANQNFTNDIIKLNQDKFYIYEVVKIIESQPLNFNDMKDNILKDWKRFKQIEKINLEIKFDDVMIMTSIPIIKKKIMNYL